MNKYGFDAPGGQLDIYKGMTMLEILISIAVFAIIALPLSQALTSGATASAITRNRDRALYLAESKIEELQSHGFFHPNLNPGDYSSPADDNVEIGAGFIREWKVEMLSSRLKEIKVEVIPPEGSPVVLRTTMGDWR